MMDSLLLKLEEKVMTLLTELEDLRNEMQNVRQENFQLKSERESQKDKLHGLLSLLESLEVTQAPTSIHERIFTPRTVDDVIAL
jgi:regulator of replication initiation timing